MAEKVSGKDLQFWYDGVEYPVLSVGKNTAWEELDTTDSSTVSPATESVVNRAKRTLKVDALLDAAHGTTLVGNNLALGTKYIVKLGNITEGTHTWPVGKCFTSDGTGAATPTNQVAALGAKLKGTGIIANVNNSASAGVVSMKYTENYGEFDSTDSNSTGDSTESITGRVKRACSLELCMVDTTVDLIEASPVATPLVLTFGAGLTISGNATFTKKDVPDVAAGDIVKVSYDLTWGGQPVSTLANMLEMGASNAFKIVYKGGGSSEKSASGTAVVTSMSIEIDVHGVGKVSYGLAVDSAVNYLEYAA